MVTKRVIVPSRLGAEPNAAAAPPPADTEPRLAALDAGPPTVPLEAAEGAASAGTAALPDAAERPSFAWPVDDADDDRAEAAAPTHSAFWPLLLLALSWLAWMAFQGWQLDRDRQTLAAARTQLEQPMNRSTQLRQALDALAADTQRLANAGNPNARLLVDELKRRGVTIDPSAPAASAPK